MRQIVVERRYRHVVAKDGRVYGVLDPLARKTSGKAAPGKHKPKP
jgi:hypothetical protein